MGETMSMATGWKAAAAVVCAGVGVILLGGCSSLTGAAPSPTESGALGPVAGSTSSPTPAATPGSTSTAAAVALPTDCKALMSAATYAKSFAGTALNDPAVVASPPALPKTELTPAMPSGGKSLYCIWREPQADVTYLSIEVAALDPATGPTVLTTANLSGRGFTCAAFSQGTRCQKISKDSEYGVEVGDTYFVRGTTGIHIGQANFPTDDLLAEVVARVF